MASRDELIHLDGPSGVYTIAVRHGWFSDEVLGLLAGGIVLRRKLHRGQGDAAALRAYNQLMRAT